MKFLVEICVIWVIMTDLDVINGKKIFREIDIIFRLLVWPPFLDAETFAASQNIKYFETSAKSGIGVEEMFTEITRQALEQKKADQPAQSNQAKGPVSFLWCHNTVRC